MLLTIDRPINKDAELHPLVRWQFVGGIEEHERRAFLFTHVTDGRGRKYAFPVVVGALAANRAVYSVGMRASVEEIEGKWDYAIANPITPRIVEHAACQEVVIEGAALAGEGNGLDRLPQWDDAAKRAVEGGYLENGRISEKLRRKGLKPETRFRPDRDANE